MLLTWAQAGNVPDAVAMLGVLSAVEANNEDVCLLSTTEPRPRTAAATLIEVNLLGTIVNCTEMRLLVVDTKEMIER